jgi:hypothetical protein
MVSYTAMLRLQNSLHAGYSWLQTCSAAPRSLALRLPPRHTLVHSCSGSRNTALPSAALRSSCTCLRTPIASMLPLPRLVLLLCAAGAAVPHL